MAYNNVVGARRASWRIASLIKQKKDLRGNEAHVTMINGDREKIESELAKICEDILDVLYTVSFDYFLFFIVYLTII
jgi:14-3-3 protein epsilon